MRVKEVMTEGVIGVQETANLYDAVQTMLDANVSAVFVFNADGAMVGILSEGDLLQRTELGSAQRRSRWIDLFLTRGDQARDYARAHGRAVSDVMTKSIICVADDADIGEAIDLMTQHHIKRLPVTRDDTVVGVISRSDILRALQKAATSGKSLPATPETDAEIKAVLEAEIAGQTWAASHAVQIFVENGIVTLEGSVGDERVRRGIVVMAENTPGVHAVRDELAWIEPNSGLVLPMNDEHTT